MSTQPKTPDVSEVAHVARLARLGLSPNKEESEQLREDFGRILSWIAVLEEIDTDDVLPTRHGVAGAGALRPDSSQPSLPASEALAAAPEILAQGFAVPKVKAG